MAKPKLEKITISYSLGIKANLGNFESGDIRLTREETWDFPEGTSVEEANVLYEARRQKIKAELDELVANEYKEMLGK